MSRRLSTSCCALLLLGAATACGSSTKKSARSAKVQEASLFVRAGGIENLRTVVDSWILILATNLETRDGIGRVKVADLKARLLEHLCIVVGGPCVSRGKPIAALLREAKLDKSNLETVFEAFEQTLPAISVPPAVQLDLISTVRNRIGKAIQSEGNPDKQLQSP